MQNNYISSFIFLWKALVLKENKNLILKKIVFIF